MIVDHFLAEILRCLARGMLFREISELNLSHAALRSFHYEMLVRHGDGFAARLHAIGTSVLRQDRRNPECQSTSH